LATAWRTPPARKSAAFAVGSFTADATTEIVTFTSPVAALVNGAQLRDITAALAAPEPASLPLLAMGLAGLVVVLRSRRA
jgi:hypothetical protein